MKSWMASMPHGTLDRWEAFDRVEPIGERWFQTATIVSILTHILSYLGIQHGASISPSEPDDLMPPRYRRPKKPKATQAQPQVPSTPKEAFKGLLGTFGFKPK